MLADVGEAGLVEKISEECDQLLFVQHGLTIFRNIIGVDSSIGGEISIHGMRGEGIKDREMND